MVVGREADRVPIPMPPTERLDCARIVEPGPQCGSGTNTLPGFARVLRVRESRNRGARRLYPKRHVAAGCYPSPRLEYILAQGDLLTGDLRLIRPTVIIATDDPAIGGRALRPVDPATFERELLGRMVPRRQAGDKRGHCSRLRVHGHDARTAVLPTAVGCLIRVGREELAALEIALEGDVDRRPCWLQSDAGCCRLAKRSGDLSTSVVEHKDVRREWVRRIECSAAKRVLFVAAARQAMTRFEHKNLEIVLVAKEGDASRHVQSFGEDRDREALRHTDISAVPRI